MTLHQRADKLLALREDLYEMHFHEVDRKWLIDAMVDFAQQETKYKDLINWIDNDILLNEQYKDSPRLKEGNYGKNTYTIT